MIENVLPDIDPSATAAYLKLHGWDRVRTGELGDRWQLRAFPRNRNVALPRRIVERAALSRSPRRFGTMSWSTQPRAGPSSSAGLGTAR